MSISVSGAGDAIAATGIVIEPCVFVAVACEGRKAEVSCLGLVEDCGSEGPLVVPYGRLALRERGEGGEGGGTGQR